MVVAHLLVGGCGGGRACRITKHDFTGRWPGECHAIGWQSYASSMYHV